MLDWCFFFKQKTAYEMRISDWSSDVCSSDLMVEIGCVELVNRVETGRTFHAYFNPGRPMPSEAQAVHGLSDAFLADKPGFHELCEDLMEFIDEIGRASCRERVCQYV